MPTLDPTPEIDAELASLDRALGAQYEILRVLGRGGMGVVYLARERLLDRFVAIKVLRQEVLNDDSRERFLREARTAARLTHPNIVPLYSFGQSGDTVFYVMGYVDGESLETHLQRVSRIAPSEASRILGELANALDYAHRNGVVHRDIKPDNVLLERGTGRAVLTDFGIAKLDTVSRMTQTGVVVGTPHYMSPEQGAGDRQIDGRSDLYSLGVMAYRMLTGRLPFEAQSLQELLAQHAARHPAPVAQLVPEIDVMLSAAVARCLEKRPDDRWPSAAAFGASLGGQGDSVSLPDAIADLPGRGFRFAITWWICMFATLCIYAATGAGELLLIAALEVPIFALVLSPGVYLARRAGLGWRRIFQLMWAPPTWWSGWWPRGLRRQGDVWDRLPKEVQAIRRMGTILNAELAVFLPISGPLLIHIVGSPFRESNGRITIAIAVVYLVMICMTVIPFGPRARRWKKKLGLPEATFAKLMSEPTWNSRFWSRPDIAPLLAPAVEIGFTETPPHTAPSLAAAIEGMLADLGELDADLARDVRATARETADVLSHIDREIEGMLGHQNREDVERMKSRLPASSDADDAGTRKMRQIIDEHLALIEQLDQRQRDLEQRRDAGLARLRTLWLQLKALRAQRALESADAAEITGRIRALCSDVGRLRSALDDVNTLTNRT